MDDDITCDYDEADEYTPCTCELCAPTRDAIEGMKAQLALAVKKGAHLLDEQFPDWRQKINPETLNLRLGYSCILGQTYGEYTKGLDRLGIAGDDPDDYGFLVSDDIIEANAAWIALNELWLEHLAD